MHPLLLLLPFLHPALCVLQVICNKPGTPGPPDGSVLALKDAISRHHPDQTSPVLFKSLGYTPRHRPPIDRTVDLPISFNQGQVVGCRATVTVRNEFAIKGLRADTATWGDLLFALQALEDQCCSTREHVGGKAVFGQNGRLKVRVEVFVKPPPGYVKAGGTIGDSKYYNVTTWADAD